MDRNGSAQVFSGHGAAVRASHVRYRLVAILLAALAALLAPGGIAAAQAAPRIAAPPLASIGAGNAAPAAAESQLASFAGGAALAWGENNYGGLGQFYRDAREEWPVPVEGLSNITAVADGGSVTLALLANGEVDSWGVNLHGQLGDNGFKANWELGVGHVPVHLSGATAIAAANEHALALIGSGASATVDAWGANAYGTLGNGRAGLAVAHTPTPVPGLVGVKAIAAGGGTDYALMANGTVQAWGSNTGGQLSAEGWPSECTRRGTCKKPEYLCGTETGMELCSKVPRYVVLANGKRLEHVKSLVASTESAYALLQSGQVMSWGQDRLGQLGQSPAVEPGPHSNFRSPRTVMMSAAKGAEVLRGVTEISAGANHVLVRLEDGEVLGWGDNSEGELGTAAHPETCLAGAETPCFRTARPVQGLSRLIAASGHHAAEALAAGGQYSMALIGHRVYAWGKNGNGELGNGSWLGPESCTTASERTKSAAKAAQKEAEYSEVEQRERAREARGEKALKAPRKVENELASQLAALRKELEKAGACSRVPVLVRQRGAEVQPGVNEAGAPLEHVSAIAAASTHALALLESGVAAPASPITASSGLTGQPATPALTLAWTREVERVLYRTFERPGEAEAEEEAGEEGEGGQCVVAGECVEVKEGNEGGSGPPASVALPRAKHQSLEEGELASEFREGQTLTASEGKWSGAEPMSFTYQWQRCSLQGACVNVGQSTSSSTYVVSQADVGSTLRVIVTAANGLEPLAPAISAPTSLVKTKEEGRVSKGESIKFKYPAPGGVMVDEIEEGGRAPVALQEGVAYEFRLLIGEKDLTTVLTTSR